MRRLLALTQSVLLLVPLAASAAAVPVPRPPRAYPAAIEVYAPYHPNEWCLPTTRVGTKALAELITRTYPGTSYGTTRPCGRVGARTSSSSEHYDGRAIDWMVSARDAGQRAKATALLGWLLATDRYGNKAAMLRRLGIMYVIWNNRMWGTWDRTWEPYLDCAQHPEASWDNTCHRTHVHLSLTWLGAKKLTSFWTGRVVQYP